MDALILAGGTSEIDDPLFPYSQGTPKSLIEIAGKPLAQWVLDALNKSKTIECIYIIGLEESCGLTSRKPIRFYPDQDDVLANVEFGFKEMKRMNPQSTHALVTSSDIPMITPEIVDWLVQSANHLDKDIYYAVVERNTMETRFPGAHRTYLRLREGEYCGADINVVKLAALENEALWNRLADSRKNPLKQATLIGFDTLFLLLIRRLTLKKAERMVTDRMGLQAEVIISLYAEIAMDVDKPHQLELLRPELEKRKGSVS